MKTLFFTIRMKEMKKLSLLILTMTLLNCAQTNKRYDDERKISSEAPTVAPEFTPACQKFMNETLPQLGWKGEFIKVPQKWDQPISESNPEIKVFFFWDASRDLSTSQPIMFFNGGPVSSAQNRADLLNKKMKQYDPDKKFVLIMMDQRGTGCSAPLIPALNQELADLKYYGSSAIATDAEQFRKLKFGKKKWKIFAQSYGGMPSHRFLMQFPKSVLEVHNHAPVQHKTFTDFFALRIWKQQAVVQKFFEKYKTDRLERAYEIASSDEMQKSLCIPASGEASSICGRVLVDGVLASVGQGYGRDAGTTEVWDGLRTNLLHLIEGRTTEFLAAATNSLGFFRNPTSLAVTVLWSQDIDYINGSNSVDCDAAYIKLESEFGLTKDRLILDECLIIQSAIPDSFGERLQQAYPLFMGKNKLTPTRILNVLNGYKNIRYYLYTGELDTYVQVPSLKGYIGKKRVKYHHFPDSGHAGWMFEPMVWQRLMQ
jgi:pimeloyl-ACP methyl ester carboxylesterase